MSSTGRRRTLASLAHHDAPLPPRRAAAVMVAVTRELERLDADGRAPTDVVAAQVELEADGSVTVRAAAPGQGDGVAAGACVGRLLFELLVGRAPLGSDDAFEPHLVAALRPSTVALLARSCSASPGQWPTASDWSTELIRIAGGQAPSLSAHATTTRRRRRTMLTAALAALIVISALVVALAPRWWDAATSGEEEGHAPLESVQARDRS